MANKNIFKSNSGPVVTAADVMNKAGGKAYSMTPKHALAQMACTGVFGSTFYVSAENQLADMQALSKEVDPTFLAKLAVYARDKGYMKDMPAYLLASISKHPELFTKAADKVLDNPKMIRNLVQILRSGAVGRKSLGTRPKKVIQNKLASYTDVGLFRGSVGNDPSLADVIKMVHPRPATPERAAVMAYLIGKPHDAEKLPQVIRDFEAFKKNPETAQLPEVPWEMLTALPLTKAHWVQIAKNASWTQTRMNLNTFARHGVFEDKSMSKLVADKLRNRELILKSKVFPYQLLSAFANTEDTTGVPPEVRNALQDAMEVATENVPAFGVDNIVVAIDTSGSMRSPITGARAVISKMACGDVAALIGSCIIRQNQNAKVMPFDTEVHNVAINARDSIMTNAKKLALRGGGTDCSAPLRKLNEHKAPVDLVVMVSDNESWADRGYGYGTGVATEFAAIRARCPKAKMVCIDLTPNTYTQARNDTNILNVGGFSDQVFSVIHSFVQGGSDAEYWTKVIENVDL
jgi:60 kDa SS-A/Ro ribonucleoprotein